MQSRYLSNGLFGAAAVLAAGIPFSPGSDQSGPVLTKAVAFVSPKPGSAAPAGGELSSRIAAAVGAIKSAVRPLSHPAALDDAFRAYFAYRTEHPTYVKKPYLYFVDYGLRR